MEGQRVTAQASSQRPKRISNKMHFSRAPVVKCLRVHSLKYLFHYETETELFSVYVIYFALAQSKRKRQNANRERNTQTQTQTERNYLWPLALKFTELCNYWGMKQHKFYGPRLEAEEQKQKPKLKLKLKLKLKPNRNARQSASSLVTQLLGQKSKKGFLCWADREQQ